ncbi:hypothetical protein L2W58_08720 [Dethiosulfovibrio sp. F2B]|nr:hypothetical protein [Dethiosulfovibrio faecalis]
MLGAMEELLGLLLIDNNKDDYKSIMTRAIIVILNKAMSGISVTAAPWILDTVNPTEEDVPEENVEEENHEEASSDPSRDLLVEWISEWLKSLKDVNFASSPLLLGKIWSRLFFGWTSIASNNKSDLKNLKTTLWKFMLLNVCCLLNAVLLEEYSFYASSDTESSPKKNAIKGLEWKNPSESPKVYFDNLEKVFDVYGIKKHGDSGFKRLKKDFPLFYTFCSCPLLIILQLIKPLVAYKKQTREKHDKAIEYIKLMPSGSLLKKGIFPQSDDGKNGIDEKELPYIWIASANKAQTSKKVPDEDSGV